MSEKPVVSHAGPLIQARAALDLADDLLERQRFQAGVDKLREAKRHLDRTMEFIAYRHPEVR